MALYAQNEDGVTSRSPNHHLHLPVDDNRRTVPAIVRSGDSHAFFA
jgi:hypothetical protein